MVEFDASMKDERAALLAMETDLRNAMRSDEIEVQYQPISYLNTMDIAGFEALARWRHPTLGLLPPAQFIELAEQVGMINEIGQTVLAQAARQLGIWQRVLRHERPFFVSVNISPSHLMEPNFLEQLQLIINRETLIDGSLKIEVTESVIMRHPERATKLFERLRSLGVGIACDDFGTGFSNLSNLRNLPFDTLKLDRSFITPESFDHRSGKIIMTITELAHSLGMVVVAEGIEEQDQVDRLAELGCDLGQGFLIGQPMPSTEVTDMLAVLPRIIAQNTPPVPAPAPARKQVLNVAPMARRLNIDLDEEPEELPSIFAMPQKAKPVLKTVKVKATAKKTKKR
jgi:EAL domain-containing protein (putative c-di-GMP-specific phosphodiesterase class I)